MSEDAAIEAYHFLVQWLRQNNLAWAADQVEEEAMLGKTEPQRIAIADVKETGLPLGRRPKPSHQSAEFLRRVEYSAYEKFNIALEAVRTLVVGSVRIQDALAASLDLGVGEIIFMPGEIGNVEHRYRTSDLGTQRAHIDEVEIYLKQLVEDVNQ